MPYWWIAWSPDALQGTLTYGFDRLNRINATFIACPHSVHAAPGTVKHDIVNLSSILIRKNRPLIHYYISIYFYYRKCSPWTCSIRNKTCQTYRRWPQTFSAEEAARSRRRRSPPVEEREGKSRQYKVEAFFTLFVCSYTVTSVFTSRLQLFITKVILIYSHICPYSIKDRRQ